MALVGLLLIPLVVSITAAFVWPSRITWKELLLQLVICLATLTGGYFAAKYTGISSTQYLNGRITSKEHGSQKCCHCWTVCDRHETRYSGTGKNRTSHRVCVASHEECRHRRDYWWSLGSTVGSFPIDFCEPDPSDVPAVWKFARVGEPASAVSSYENYLKADPNSILVHTDVSRYAGKVPSYPETHDVYHRSPVISDGPAIPAGWQDAVNEINADFGHTRQVDVTVVLTHHQDRLFAQALEAEWLYGPKNSVNVVMGVSDNQITWAQVVTISKVEALKVELRDALQGMPLTLEPIQAIREAIDTKFHRTHLSEYKYLLENAEPSTWALIVLYVLGVLLSVGGSILMHQNDLFHEEAPWNSYRKRYK